MRNITSSNHILCNYLPQFNPHYLKQRYCALARCTSQCTRATLSLYIVFCCFSYHKNSRSLTSDQHYTHSGNGCPPYGKITFWNDFYCNNCCPANECLWSYIIILCRYAFCSSNYTMWGSDLYNIPYTKQVATTSAEVSSKDLINSFAPGSHPDLSLGYKKL